MNTLTNFGTNHPSRRFFKIHAPEVQGYSNKPDPVPKIPTEIPVISISPKVTHLPHSSPSTNPLLTYEEINHHKGRLFFHIWGNENVVAVTNKDVTFNTTEDCMVMILRFPFSSKGQYFATATSFIDAGFSTFDYVEHLDDLVDLKLD